MTKQQLIEDNMGLVYSLIQREYPTFRDDEDIIQTGMLGLCKAAETWDESIGKFSTFAYICIRNVILTELKYRSKHKGVWSLDHPFTNDNGETGTLQECLVGEEDVNYVDTYVDEKKLNEKQQRIYELLLEGVVPKEIAKQVGVTHQYVSVVKRKLRLLRSRKYGD